MKVSWAFLCKMGHSLDWLSPLPHAKKNEDNFLAENDYQFPSPLLGEPLSPVLSALGKCHSILVRSLSLRLNAPPLSVCWGYSKML